MILRSPPRRPPAARPDTPLGRRPRGLLAAVLLLPLALGACTNSKLVIGPLYNRLDDRMRKEFEELGDFDERQTGLFEAGVGTYHVWHRRNELPAYARLLGEIAASVARDGATSLEDVTRWGELVEAHALAARECHPINFSSELLRSLSDEELDVIEQHFARERQENRERYLSRTPEERVEYRLKNVRKWAGRIGVDLTAEQNAMLRTAFTEQVSLRREYYLLSERWRATFFRLARDRQAPDREARVAAHLGELWTLLENAHPDEWERNRELWRGVALRFVASMTPEQRTTASAWLAKLGETLTAVSRDEPSFVVDDDPSVGCLVDTAATDSSGEGPRPGG